LSGDIPKGWKQVENKRRKLAENSNDDPEVGEDAEDEDNDGNRGVGDGDYSSDGSKSSNKTDDDFDDSVGSIDEEIAAAVEREFLS
jgi:phosphopantothenoylcysteine synthetase/decarboxylase